MTIPTAKELEAEMAALDAKRKAASALLMALRDYEAANAALMPVGSGDARTKHEGRSPSAAEATESVAVELMERAKGPVAVSDVVEEMAKRGIPLPEKNTNNVISARLSNSPKFKGRRGYGYWFSDREWPDENFDNLLG